MKLKGERIWKYDFAAVQKPKRQSKRTKKRKARMNKHHMTNACRGGKSTESNLLNIKIERHATIHKYFQNMSWEEIADALYQMFGMSDPLKCYEMMQRISHLKGRL